MQVRLARRWEDLRQSFWFLPTVMAVGAVIAAVTLAALEPLFHRWIPKSAAGMFFSDPVGARSVLATIASSEITVAGVLFSITIVVLNMASAQFGPRLIPTFMKAGGTQVALGTFLGSFIYCLTVLSMIGDAGESAEVPQLAVAGGLVSGVASFGVLVYFLHHVAIFIQAPRIIDDVARQVQHGIESGFPPRDEAGAEESAPEQDLEDVAEICAPKAGYLQAVDAEDLVGLATRHDLCLRLEIMPGEYVSRGDVLMKLVGQGTLSDELADQVRQSLVIGPQRTQSQDPAHGVYQLVEIALRALSPGINDPFTAISCIDRLGNVLGILARRGTAPTVLRDDERRPRLLRSTLSHAQLVNAAFDQLRRICQDHLDVALHLFAVITNLLRRELPPDMHRALLEQAGTLFRSLEERRLSERDRTLLEAAWTDLERVTAGQSGHEEDRSRRVPE